MCQAAFHLYLLGLLSAERRVGGCVVACAPQLPPHSHPAALRLDVHHPVVSCGDSGHPVPLGKAAAAATAGAAASVVYNSLREGR